MYRVTLTGLGERVHLATSSVGLRTHIADVVNTIVWEELTDIVLVGHSYGGMVITGVADELRDRIRRRVRCDSVATPVGHRHHGRDHLVLPASEGQFGRHQHPEGCERVLRGVRNQAVRRDDTGGAVRRWLHESLFLGIEPMLGLHGALEHVVPRPPAKCG